ncbi:MAG: metal ABC transporter permease [Candidatus Margulisbacteria bacterium]|nr:metal ABC transporter permease [Candidatus Margulisiibacteriota bacterium]
MLSILSLVNDHTFQVVLLGTLVLGITSGSLGCFAVLRKQSLLGDAISHATLPGIAIAFMMTYSKNAWILLTGAALAGLLGTFLMMGITKFTKIKQDTALGIILSVFFGFGLVLLTIIQKIPTASQAGLDTFLFGNAATLLKEDIRVMIILGIFTCSVMAIFWKEFKLISFDPDFAKSMGLPITKIEILLTTLIVLAIVIGLQTVGVVLMSAMIIAPAAAARQWTDNLGLMVFLAAIFSAFSGMAGTVLSSSISHLPTGPVIVLIISSFVIISLIAAPNRGLLWAYIQHHIHQREVRTKTMLSNLLLFSESQTNPFHPHDIAALTAIGKGTVSMMLKLKTDGLVNQYPDNKWSLSPKGLKIAQSFSKEGNINHGSH